jgi:hypothetical protein
VDSSGDVGLELVAHLATLVLHRTAQTLMTSHGLLLADAAVVLAGALLGLRLGPPLRMRVTDTGASL